MLHPAMVRYVVGYATQVLKPINYDPSCMALLPLTTWATLCELNGLTEVGHQLMIGLKHCSTAQCMKS